jgi:hypothetical protein
VERRIVPGQAAFALLCAGIVFSVSHAIAQQEAQPSWDYQRGNLVYGWNNSDVLNVFITCRDGTVNVDIMIRPQGKPGDKTSIKFKNGASEVRYTATLTELDGIGGDDVEFSIPPSDKLFDLLMRPGPVVAQVPGAAMTLPEQNGGRAKAAMAFRKGCVSSKSRPAS